MCVFVRVWAVGKDYVLVGPLKQNTGYRINPVMWPDREFLMPMESVME